MNPKTISSSDGSVNHSDTRKIELLKGRRNARSHSPEQVNLIAASMREFGWTTPVLIDENDVVLAGYGRIEAAKLMGLDEAPVLIARGWTEAQKKAYMLADNQIAIRAGWDEELLKLEMDDLKLMDFDLSLIGFPDLNLVSLLETGKLDRPVKSLRERFILPPFSILDARSGWWQDRRRAWLALGIQSELGRGDNALRFSSTILQPDPAKRTQRMTEKTSRLDPDIAAAL
jgi:ParB-like chromosome segregation protein Spo0J